MTEYRDRTTGEIKTQGELRRDNANISMPRVWNDNVYNVLNVDPIFPTVKPTTGIGQYQHAVRNGVTQDSNGNWVEAWQIVDMFSDGDAGTKEEQEAAYQTKLDENAAESNRSTRDFLLSDTDWWAVSDRIMTSAQTTYRQALRDITTHSNWPHLESGDWPTKP